MAYYHGSTEKIKKIEPDFFCVTDDKDVAVEYGSFRGECYVHTVSLPGDLNLAGEDELERIAGELGLLDECYYTFEKADNTRIREALRQLGFDGIRYRDMSPNNSTEHSTILLFDGSVATIESVEFVEE
jgi:hypothetical protein